MQKLRLGIILGFFYLLFSVQVLGAVPSSQEPELIAEDKEVILLGRVTEVISSKKEKVPNTEVDALYQEVVVTLLEGGLVGTRVTLDDSSFNVNEGDKVYVRHLLTKEGEEYFYIQEVSRTNALLILFLAFTLLVLLIGGKQGFLSLLSLFVSFGVIFKLLFPAMLHGGNIIFIATAGALAALSVVMFITHGFTRLSVSAYLGCVGSVLVTLFLALYFVKASSLSGFATEESVFLNLATKGGLDFVALLIGGIIIGVIGVIDDIAITQASVVGELKKANESLTARELYLKAMKVGKDHMGAVVNTLILAYTGASLPLVLLLYSSEASFIELINREMIATEIIRTLVSSLGLLVAVPLTTLVAVFLMKKDTKVAHHHHH